MKVYRAIPFIGGDHSSSHECEHHFSEPDPLMHVCCDRCHNAFQVVDDERNQPASWWQERRERYQKERDATLPRDVLVVHASLRPRLEEI